MHKNLIVSMILVLLGPTTFAEDSSQGEANPQPTPTQRISKALNAELVALDGEEHTLNELLQLFGKITNENFILDPSLPQSVGATKLRIQAKKGGSILDAFAVALALSGLRYALLDSVIFISTEGKLSDRLLHGKDEANPVGTSKARTPMDAGEALVRSQALDPDQEGFVTGRDFISHEPWRTWESPRYNPKTGLTDYPGPPIWIEDPDVGHPRFRYTTTQYFLKPEYLALEQEKHKYRMEQERRARAKQDENAKMLSAVLRLLKENPDMKANEIVRRLGLEEDM